jgi:large subunit ribosomal protein L6
MSRIGRLPVSIPSDVEVSVSDGRLLVKRGKTTLEQQVAPHTRIEIGEGSATVHRDGDESAARAAHGLMRSLLANMVHGVTQGFSKGLDLIGVGYRAEVQGKDVKLSVGFSQPKLLPIPEGIEVVAESPTRLVVKGPDKQRVGQFAAEIRAVRPPEPYKGKGIRYVDERVRRKVGKAGVGG